ncbi:hypothetical protein MKX03_014593 [Papaver bracteatum]|nr:hypothetical protein MKX03_014593 [Papaver bracteatum]
MVNIIFADPFQDRYDQFECDFFTLKVIKAATKNFNPANVIRQDFFHSGNVTYKGVLPNGVPIEVRKISKDTTKDGEFNDKIPQYLKNVDFYVGLRHQNLIRLLGHYTDSHYILLVMSTWRMVTSMTRFVILTTSKYSISASPGVLENVDFDDLIM